jgi:hypothetical protein
MSGVTAGTHTLSHSALPPPGVLAWASLPYYVTGQVVFLQSGSGTTEIRLEVGLSGSVLALHA